MARRIARPDILIGPRKPLDTDVCIHCWEERGPTEAKHGFHGVCIHSFTFDHRWVPAEEARQGGVDATHG